MSPPHQKQHRTLPRHNSPGLPVWGPSGKVEERRTSPMIPTPPKPKYTPGRRFRVIQQARLGNRRWVTSVEGVVEGEGFRPVGGMEMGGKASYCFQPTIRLRRDDGEITVIAVDDDTEVLPVHESYV